MNYFKIFIGNNVSSIIITLYYMSFPSSRMNNCRNIELIKLYSQFFKLLFGNILRFSLLFL